MKPLECAIKMAKNVQKRLDIKIVSSEDDLEEHFLIDGDELLIPLADIGGTLASFILIRLGIRGRKRFATVMFAVLENLIRHNMRSTSHHKVAQRVKRRVPSS